MRSSRFLSRLAMLVLLLSAFTLSPAQAAPPSNDDFDNATTIGSLPFSDSRDTREATFADDDPPCTPLFRTEEATVWYAFTAASDQQVLISTAGSSYNATLAVFTGTRGALSQLASVCENPVNAQVRLDVEAGTTYFIMAGVFTSPPVSNLALSVTALTPPSNDEIAAATAITSLPFTDRRDVRAATASASDPFCSGQGRTVWYTLTPTQSGQVAVFNANSTYSVILSVHSGTPSALNEVACSLSPPTGRVVFNAVAGTTYFIVAGADDVNQAGTLGLTIDRMGGNDAIATAFPVAELPFIDQRDVAELSAAAGDPACFSGRPTAWYRYTPPVAARLTASADVNLSAVGIYRGTPGALTQLACGLGDPLFATRAVAAANATAGTTYYIGVSGSADTPSSTIFTTISAGPANDDFDAAAPIGAVPFSTATDLRGATGDFDDPGCGGGGAFGGANLWYVYHAVDARRLEATASSLGFDVELGVFTGARGSLTQQGCGGASVIFQTSPGETYYIAVGTSFSLDYIADARMTIGLNTPSQPAAHDDFAQRLVVSALPFSDSQDGRIATTATNDPACGNRINTYWYAYRPQTSQWILAYTSGHVLGIYKGSRGALRQVFCSSDPQNGQGAFLGLTAGTTYYFMIGSSNGNEVAHGLFFSIEQVPPPPPPLKIKVKIDSQAKVLLRSGEAKVKLTVTCSREAYINIGGQLSQRIGRRTISGQIEGTVYCTDKVSTSVLVRATKGRFLPVDAKAAVYIEAYDTLRGEVVSANHNKTVRLQLARR